MLFQEIDKLKRDVIMTSIILMFGGAFLLILPEEYVPMISDALGFGMLVLAVLSVFSFIGGAKVPVQYIKLCFGLLAGTGGVALWIFDSLFMGLLVILVGSVPIISGLYGVFHAVAYARRSGRTGWWILLILSLALFGFGCFAFFNPWMKTGRAVMQITGGVLMGSSIISGLRLIWLLPQHQE